MDGMSIHESEDGKYWAPEIRIKEVATFEVCRSEDHQIRVEYHSERKQEHSWLYQVTYVTVRFDSLFENLLTLTNKPRLRNT